jgi:hypothetical protein
MNIRLILASILFISIGCSKQKIVFSNNPDAPDYLHNRVVGASANEILSPTKYTSLLVEVQYMSGYAPDANAMTTIQNFLNNYINKPGGISIVTKQLNLSTSATFNLDQVKNIEETNRTGFTSGSQIAIYILYAGGNYTDNNVIGLAYRNTSIVIFGKTVHDNSGGIGQVSRSKLEATVAEHELGHLLGLVNLGSPMQTNHQDGTHPNHCSNNNCLMYYASNTRDVLGFLQLGNIPSLDATCAADLRANGGK